MDPFPEVEEAMEEAAPVDQSSQEISKGSPTDSTSTVPNSYDVSKPSSPCSSPVVLTHSSPSVIPSVTTPPYIPVKVEYLSDTISVPPPLLRLFFLSIYFKLLFHFNLTCSQCCRQPWFNQLFWPKCPSFCASLQAYFHHWIFFYAFPDSG